MNGEKVKTIPAHPRRKLPGVSLGVLAISGILLILVSAIALAAPIFAVDDAGADDEPGQKDLNTLTVDYGIPGATTINVQWGWDDTATSGSNTRDGCSLFDTDGDGFANFSLCVTVASNGSSTTTMYACTADNRTDRCAGSSPVSTFASTAGASVVTNSDPFGFPSSTYYDPAHVTGNTCDNKPGCYTNDTIANANIVLTDFGNPADVSLINVCSYPSQQPNSDPSDCIFEPDSGFLTIVKVSNPNDGTAFVFNASEPSRSGDSSWAINGSGSVQMISYAATTTLDLSEVTPAGWQLDSASCEIQNSSPEATGTPTPTGVDNLEIRPGIETICTFNDSLAQGTLTLVKVVDNLGESGPGYLGIGDFPLTIDGTPTTSGSPVAVSAGDHQIAETPQSGYTVGTWSCTDGTTGTAGSATANVNVSGGENVTCTMTNTLIAAPSMTVEKSSTTISLSAPGTVTYNYLVTNTGNVTLTGITLSDDNDNNDMSCPYTSLAPGGTMICSATHTFTQAELDANGSPTADSGVLYNFVTASSNEAPDATDELSIPIAQGPALNVVKSSTTTVITAAGQVVPYTFVVTNTGNVALSEITVSDPNCDATPQYVSGDTDLDNKLDLSETWTYTCSHTVSQAEIDTNGGGDGDLDNTVTADSNESDPDTDDHFIPITQNPHLTLLKTGVSNDESGDGYAQPGETITYSFLVTNDGNVTLHNVTVTDPLPGLSAISCPKTTLVVGESMTCTATYVVTQADINAGHVANTATADSDESGPDSDSEEIQLKGLYKVFIPMVNNHFVCASLTAFGLTIGYEDLPVAGFIDYDYNDWIVDVQGKIDLSSFPTCGLQKLELTIIPQARGASFDHKFHLVFPANIFPSNGTATLTIYDQNGNPLSSTPSPFVANAQNDITIFAKTSNVLPPLSNTDQSKPKYIPAMTAKLSIVFNTPGPFAVNVEDLISPRGEGLFFDPRLDVLNSGEVVKRGDFRLLVVPVATYLWPEETVGIYNVYSGVTFISAGNLSFQPNWWLSPRNNCVYDDKPCPLLP